MIVRVYHTCHVINVILDNKPEAVGFILVLLNIGGGVRFAHGDRVVDGTMIGYCYIVNVS